MSVRTNITVGVSSACLIRTLPSGTHIPCVAVTHYAALLINDTNQVTLDESQKMFLNVN